MQQVAATEGGEPSTSIPQTPMDIDKNDTGVYEVGSCLVHTVVFQDVGLVWSDHKRRRVGSGGRQAELNTEQEAEPQLVEVDEQEQELAQLQQLGLPTSFGDAKMSAAGFKPHTRKFGAEWCGEVRTQGPSAAPAAPAAEAELAGADSGWQQAYDAATSHFYYYCEATQETQWEAPGEGYRPALQEWLPGTPAEGAEPGARSAAAPSTAEYDAGRIAQAEPEAAAQAFDLSRSPYQQAVQSYMRYHGWLPEGPEPEEPAPDVKLAKQRPARRRQKGGAGREPGSAEPPPRMESTGLMPRIPDPSGTHIRFDSSDEEGSQGCGGGAALRNHAEALPAEEEAGHAGGNAHAAADVLADIDAELLGGSPPGGAVHALEEEMQQLLVEDAAVANDAALTPAAAVAKRKKKGGGRRRGGAGFIPGAHPPDLPARLHKYWLQRYSLFSRYDEGVALDEEGWFSATPEVIAWHHAKRVAAALGPACVAVDAFAGVGGNAIQLAMTCARVIAVEVDPARAELLRANAAVYGVADKVEVLCADFFEVASTLRADVAFFSPPWGGPEYAAAERFDPGDMGGDARFGAGALLDAAFAAMGCRAAALWLPRNCCLAGLEAVLAAAPAGAGAQVEVERAVLNGRVKAVTAYFGELARDPRTRQPLGQHRERVSVLGEVEAAAADVEVGGAADSAA